MSWVKGKGQKRMTVGPPICLNQILWNTDWDYNSFCHPHGK